MENKSISVEVAGGVWVAAVERLPKGTNRKTLCIKYKSSIDMLVYLDDKWCWYDGNNSKNLKVDKDSWPDIQWLDESALSPLLQQNKDVQESLVIAKACWKCEIEKNDDLTQQILELKATIVDLDAAAGASAELMVRVMELEEENGRLKEFLREFIMRANYAFPMTEQDLEWFESGTDGKTDYGRNFLIRLFEISGLEAEARKEED